MTRPCFLVIDREYAGSISTRKLVIETAKFNVVTAYSSGEALETLKRFPALDGIVLDSNMHDMPCAELVHALRGIAPGMPIIAIDSPGSSACDGVDHQLASFQPARLLELLQGLHRQEADAIEKHDAELSRSNPHD